MKKLLWFAPALLALSMAANAAVITETYQGTVSGLTDSSHPTLVPPYSSLDFSFTVTFDPAVSLSGFNAVDAYSLTPDLGVDYGPFGFQYDSGLKRMTIGDHCLPVADPNCSFTVSGTDIILTLSLTDPDNPSLLSFVYRATGTYPTGGSALGTFRPTTSSITAGDTTTAVPEPGALALLALALGSLAILRRRRA